MSTTAVEKGLQFEKAVVDMLNKCGFRAWRTNQSNEADPERYKAVFVDRSQFFAIFDIDSSSTKPLNISFHVSSER